MALVIPLREPCEKYYPPQHHPIMELCSSRGRCFVTGSGAEAFPSCAPIRIVIVPMTEVLDRDVKLHHKVVSLLRIYSSGCRPAEDLLLLVSTFVSPIPLIQLLNQSTRRRTIALPPCSLRYHPLASCCSSHYTAGVRIDGKYLLRISVCLTLALIACHERHLTTTPAAIFDTLYIAEPTPTPQLRSSTLANRDNRCYWGWVRRDLH